MFHRNQMMKDKSGIFPKLKLVEAVSKSLKDNSVCLFSSLHLPCGCGEGLECQQDGLERAPDINRRNLWA